MIFCLSFGPETVKFLIYFQFSGGKQIFIFLLTQTCLKLGFWSWISFTTASPRTESKVNAQYVFVWMNPGLTCGFRTTETVNISQDAAAPSAPGSTGLSLPFTCSWFIFCFLLFLWCWRWISQMQEVANTSYFPREEMKSQQGYDSDSVLNQQTNKLYSPVTETRVPLSFIAPRFWSLLQASVIWLRWVGNTKSRALKISCCIEAESLCNTGSTQFKVRQAGPDYKALGSQSCFIRLGEWDALRGSVDPWVVTISEQLETCHSGACPNFSPSLAPPAAKEALPSGQQAARQSTRRRRVGPSLLTSAHLGFFPTTTCCWCPFWKSAFSPSCQ